MQQNVAPRQAYCIQFQVEVHAYCQYPSTTFLYNGKVIYSRFANKSSRETDGTIPYLRRESFVTTVVSTCWPYWPRLGWTPQYSYKTCKHVRETTYVRKNKPFCLWNKNWWRRRLIRHSRTCQEQYFSANSAYFLNIGVKPHCFSVSIPATEQYMCVWRLWKIELSIYFSRQISLLSVFFTVRVAFIVDLVVDRVGNTSALCV